MAGRPGNGAEMFKRRSPDSAKEVLSDPGIRHLLWLAGFFVIGSLALYFFSIFGFLPQLHNGQGIWNFASDAFEDHILAGFLADRLREGDYSGWWALPVHANPAYVKIYSVFYYLLGKSPLSLLPLNAVLYLVVVLMTFSVGKALFSEPVGLWSAVLVGVLPSFFLQATQSAKDALYIGGQLLILHAITLLVVKVQNKRTLSIIAANSMIGLWILWLIRPYMLQLAAFLWLCALVIGVVRGLKGKRQFALSFGVGAIVLGIFAGVSGSWRYDWSRVLIDSVRGKQFSPDPKIELEYCRKRKMADNGFCMVGCPRAGRYADVPFCLIMLVEHTRWKFRTTSQRSATPEAGSNIGRHVSFQGPGDIFRYVPRAIQIGLAAPFPAMWFSSGQATEKLGRWIAGVETGLMYVGLLLAAFGVWKERRNPAVLLVSFFVFCGITLLGLVVVNIGALYRQRYIFWFLLIILAVQGFVRLRERPPWSRRAGQERLG